METISGAQVSKFSFGTMQFGDKASKTDSAEMYADCREAGINFFDTAHAYTGGTSETILGELVRAERDEVFIATKCAESTVATPERIRNEFSESRKRLGIELVDILYLHRWDKNTPLEETYEEVAKHVEEGSIRYVGVSNYSAWQVMKARKVAQGFGIDIQFIQPMYNLVKRQVEVEILPMAISEGFSVCPYSPLGGGLLTGKYASGGGGRIKDNEMYAARYAQDWMHTTASELSALASDLDVSPATLAVAWAANHPGVHGPIISARSSDQLIPSLAAVGFELEAETYDRITALSPAPPPATDRLEEA